MPFIPDPNNPTGPFIEISQAEYDIWVKNVVSRNSAVNAEQAESLQEVPPTAPPPPLSSVQTEANSTTGQAVNEYGDSYTPLPPPPLSSVQTEANSTTGQAVNEYGDSYTPLPPVSAADIITSNSATAGLTPAQLQALGGADPSDPFIRARLDLPPLGTAQPTLIDALAGGLPNITNPLPGLGDIVGNAFSSISGLFTSTTPTVPVSQVQTSETVPAGTAINEYGDSYTPLPPVPLNEIQTQASTDTEEELVQLAGPTDSEIQTQADTTTEEELIQLAGPTDNEVQTLADTNTQEELVQLAGPTDNDILTEAQAADEATYQQLVEAFSEAEVQTGPAPFAPIAALDETPLVPVSAIDAGPAEVDPTVNPEVETPFVETEGGLNVLPEDIPVEQQGNELVDLNTGQVLAIDENGFTDQGGLNVLPEDIPVEQQGNELIDLNTGQVLAVDENGFVDQGGLLVLPEDIPNQEAEDQELVPIPGTVDEADVAREPGSYSPEELDAIAAAQGVDAGDGGDIPESALYRNEAAAQNPYNNLDQLGIETGTFTGDLFNPNAPADELAASLAGARLLGQNQPTVASLRKQANNGDWRVRLRLAPQSRYLYNAPSPGILQPLQVTDGVIFPYTPKIDITYKAYYDQYDLTHSNYRGYFYKNSAVESVTLTGTFTAQSTAEANYLLAVISFFKSVTKMFYGQDTQRGAPPPMCYLTGLGQYQFNESPCLVTSFQYSLPDNVDYIRAQSTADVGINMTNQRSRQSVSTNSLFGSVSRLAAALLPKGAIQGPLAPPSLGLNSPTYVPTKMEITLGLLPVQSRQQVSKQFSLKEFANGNLIKGGFW